MSNTGGTGGSSGIVSGDVESSALISPYAKTRRGLSRVVRSLSSGQLNAYLLIAPKLFVFAVFLLGPIFYTVYLSLRSGTVLSPGHYSGLTNYRVALHDQIFWTSVKNTLLYCVLVIPVTLSLALVLAAFLNLRLRFRGFFRAALIVPTVTPTVAAAIIWAYLLQGQGGVINNLLGGIGIKPVFWLGNPSTVVPVIALVEFWRGLGFYTVVFLAGMQSIPRHIYEAAALDGLVGVRAFLRITVPLLRPVIQFATVMATIFSFQVFDTPYVMTHGGPGFASTTMVVYIYRAAFALNEMGLAASMSLMLLIAILVLSILQLRIFRRNLQY